MTPDILVHRQGHHQRDGAARRRRHQPRASPTTSTTTSSPHGHTYEAHPLTLAPAIAAIDEYRRLNLLNRSSQMSNGVGIMIL